MRVNIAQLHSHLLSLTSSSVANISKFETRYSRYLNYFLRFFSSCESLMPLDRRLRSQVEKVSSLLGSLQNENGKHPFPLLRRSAQNILKQKACGLSDLYYSKEINLKSIVPSKKDDINEMELSLLTSTNINQILEDILTLNIVLQNPHCICCNQIRIETPSPPTIASISKLEDCNKNNLERYFCGLCNEGGGVLLIGVERAIDKLFTKGIRFKNKEQKQRLQNIIRESLGKVQPSFEYKIQKVIVHTNFIFPVKPHHQFLRFCYRILIYPLSPFRLAYIRTGNSNQVYALSQQAQYSNKISFYELAHKKINLKITANPHTRIKSYDPLEEYSTTFEKAKSCNTNEIASSSEEEKKIQVKFKYKNTSLIVLGKKVYNRYVQDFSNFLTKQKHLFEISQPFVQLYKEGLRSIWMISHNLKQDELKNLLHKAELKKLIPPSRVVLMPVTKALRISRQFCKQKHEDEISEQFSIKFKRKMRKQVKIFEQKQFCVFSYDDYVQSIYAYMLFESQKLRPYFINEIKY